MNSDNDLRQVDDTPEQLRIRAEKRQTMLDRGIDPYPVILPITSNIKQVRQKHEGLEADQQTSDIVGLAGRVVFLRNTGKLCFVTLQDGEGNKLQAMFSVGEIGLESLSDFKAMVDLGDHLFVHGRVIASKRGELSVFVSKWQLAAKALRPLPKTYVNDKGEMTSLSEESRVRRRHLDLIMREDARKMVRERSAVVRSIREYFHSKGFIEIETPMLQILHGGASARPFVTHMNAFDTDLYLRIAPELYLKRAVIGGIDKVFEINRNFRNEGADSSHSPEFSMLEAYEAYGNYDTVAEITTSFIKKVARDVYGSEIVTLHDGTKYDFSGQWQQLSLYDSLSEAVGKNITPETSEDTLRSLAKKFDIDIPDHALPGKIVEELWEELVGHKLYKPTFVRDFPVDTSPLTRDHRSKKGVVEKWDLYVRGFELATGYSELVDPVIQRERFESQALAAAKGDPEAMVLDEDFLEAMEQGMPPAGGMGMGLDRLLMALTGLGIRETITFPLVKRETKN